MSTLAAPLLFLALMGWLVPKLLSMVMPEGLRPLLLLSLFATCIMFLISCLFFLALYLMQGATINELFEPGVASTIVHFGRLGLSAAIVWAPILVLSVAGLPRNWTKETW